MKRFLQAFAVAAAPAFFTAAHAVSFRDIDHMAAPTAVSMLIFAPQANALIMKNSASAIAVMDIPSGLSTFHYANTRFTDMTMSPSGRMVFAADYGGENGYGAGSGSQYVHRLDLSIMAWDQRIAGIAGNVQAASDTKVILKSMDQWVSFTYNDWGSGIALTTLNSSAGCCGGPGYYAGVYYGDFRYDPRSSRLLHGSAGSSSQEIQAFKIVSNNFVKQEGSGTYGNAQGHGGTVALASDGSAFYYGDLQVDPLDVTHNLRVFPEAIYAATGKLAFGNGKYYNARTGALVGLLPFASTVYGLNPSGDDFWAYDPATFTLHHFVPPRADDVNGDVQSDVLWRNVSTGQIYRLLMDGLSIAGQGFAYAEPDITWKVVGNADFNGDGIGDLLWRNEATGRVWVQFFNASGLPSGGDFTYSYAESDRAWKIVATPDVDGDGKADLVWWNSSTGDVAVALLNGASLRTRGLVYREPDTAWKIVGAGDFDGSGASNKLLWRNGTTGSVYLMAVTYDGLDFTQRASEIYREPNTAWQIVGTPDFNGDGKSDILWRNAVTGQVYIMLMNGYAISAGALVYTEPNTAWKIVANGDYDGDGRADLLWYNEATGQVYMMLVDGLSIRMGAMVYTEPNTAWTILGPWRYGQDSGVLQ